MELKKQIDALKVFIGDSPVISVLRRLLARVDEVEASIPLPTDLTPLHTKLGEIEGKVSQGFSQVETELNKAILLAESNGTELDSFAEKNVQDFKEAAGKLEQLRTDLLERLAHRGGGNANRNIVVEGQTVLTPYTDINFVGTTSSITAMTDFVAHQTKIIIPTGGGGAGNPAAPDTSVQFNDAGSFGGNSNFYFVKTSGAGFFNVKTADGVTSQGARLTLSGGDVDDPDAGGGFEQIAGSAGDTGDGGSMLYQAGSGGATSGAGGSISLTAGSAQGGDSDGGSILLRDGNPSGAGTPGGIHLQSSDTNLFLTSTQIRLNINDTPFAILDTSLLSSGDKTFTFPDATGTLALQTAASGSFTTADLKTVTVVNGVITSIV